MSAPTPTAVPTTTARLTPHAAQHIARLTNLTVAVLALAAAVLSYDGLHRLALDAGVPAALGYLLPIVVDGLVVVGSLSTVYAALAGLSARWPWTLVGTGVLASVVGNVMAAQPTTVARVVAAVPPVVLCLALETALRLQRHRAGLPAVSRSTRTRASASPPTSAAPVSMPAPSPTVTPAHRPTRPRNVPPTAPRTGGPTIRESVRAVIAADPGVTLQALYALLPGRDESSIRRAAREYRAAQAPADLADRPPVPYLAAVGSN